MKERDVLCILKKNWVTRVMPCICCGLMNITKAGLEYDDRKSDDLQAPPCNRKNINGMKWGLTMKYSQSQIFLHSVGHVHEIC